MLLKYSFIPVITCMLGALSWWSTQVGIYPLDASSGLQANKYDHPSLVSHRRELIETLDHIIAYEHYYHSVYGHFTKLVNKTGYTISRSMMNVYDIRVVDATQDRVLVSAISEVDGKVLDIASIDQDYQIHTNFKMPDPRAAYLKSHARKYLRIIQSASEGHTLEEEGIYKGYFKYSVREDSKNGKTAFAVGVKPPVVGVQLEFSDADLNTGEVALNDLDAEVRERNHLGQKSEGDVAASEEETYLAQKIFHGEMGRYATTWSELSKIAHFKFEGKTSDGVVAEEEQSSHESPESEKLTRKISSDTSSPGGLIIEPIGSSSN